MNIQEVFNIKDEITKYLKEEYFPNILPQVLEEYLQDIKNNNLKE